MRMSYGQDQLWLGDKTGQLHLVDATDGDFNLIEVTVMNSTHLWTYSIFRKKFTKLAIVIVHYNCSYQFTILAQKNFFSIHH